MSHQATALSHENGGNGARKRADRDAGELTRREIEVLDLVSQGLTNRAVARKLWVTDQTVKFHLSNIYRKLGVSNRVEASHWAYERQTPQTGV